MRIPLYIEFSGKNVLIIGGGGVGTVRAKKFKEAGANVRVLSLDFSEELKKMDVELIRGDAKDEKLLEENIKWCDLVTVAVKDLSVNDLVIELSKKYKALVNLANDAKRTEVVIPFDDSVDGIRFAVTTEGKSGIVARIIRDKIRELIEKDRETQNLLKAMEFLKRYMKENNIPVEIRMKMYFAISKDEKFKELVSEGKVEEAKEYAINYLREYMNGKREIKDEGWIRF
uniref:precorrin-2 dehydrogenase n=1 Tax=Geoglobus ahangari TaxID=113653 RepID=A0A7C4W3M1_9EURY